MINSTVGWINTYVDPPEHGQVGATFNLYAATQAGDYDGAKVIYEDLSPLLRFIVAGGLPTTVKAGLNLLGTHVGDPRPPLLPIDEAGLDEMRSLLID